MKNMHGSLQWFCRSNTRGGGIAMNIVNGRAKVKMQEKAPT